MIEFPSVIVDVPWLQSHLGDTQLKLLDASVPPVVPGFQSINAQGPLRVIPGALRFDYDRDICKPNSSLPHMMPDAQLFQDKLRALGINAGDAILVYDDVGFYASPRAYWMLRAMGHERVALLNGGLPAWLDAGGDSVGHHAQAEQTGDFTAREQPDWFCDFQRVLQAIEEADTTILDARSSGRFHGLEPEPRPGLREGHMPTARNLPCAEVVEAGKLKSPAQLQQLLAPLVPRDHALVTSCGSGVTACMLALAALVAGYERISVYDGSWAEWGQPSKLPVICD